ncbi:MAG: hypothetical protein R3F39_14485 [Myxococcota bacterium]
MMGTPADAANASAIPVGTYAGRLRDVDACVVARLGGLAGRALDAGCGVRLARGAGGGLTPFAPTSEELAAALPALEVTALDAALPQAAVRFGDVWVALDGAGRAGACLLQGAELAGTVQLERAAHHPDGARVGALCWAELAPRAEAWWAATREEAARAGRVALRVSLDEVPALAALPGVRRADQPLAELLDRPVERHAEAAQTPLTGLALTIEALAATGAEARFDLVRLANVTAFMPDAPAASLLRAAAAVAREGAWLVEAGTVALAGGALLTALALAENSGGTWRPRELWLSPAATPTFLARGGAELPAVLGAAGPPLVRALVEADRSIRSAGALPDAATMASALGARGQRTWTAPGLSLVGVAVRV